MTASWAYIREWVFTPPEIPTIRAVQMIDYVVHKSVLLMRMFAKLGGVTGTSIGLTITVRFTYEDPIRLVITSIKVCDTSQSKPNVNEQTELTNK